jgi:replicative DNA helicase
VEGLNSISEVLQQADLQLDVGESAAARVWSTGFSPLDTYLNGGLRSGELTLLGGPQGLGKTTLALQVLRNVVAAGECAVYFSFEHDAVLVLERILAVEAGVARGLEAATLRRFREALEASDGRLGGLEERMAVALGGAEAVEAVRSWGDRLLVHRSSGSTTSVGVIAEVVEEVRRLTGNAPLVVVDYLQKVAVPGSRLGEEERVTEVVEGLKDLALTMEVPVLAIVAADKEGIQSGRRLRTHHLRGSSALAYEADVVLVMNDKFDVVARHHLVYDVSNAETFRNFVVVSIEKNRNGLDRIDLQFRKRFEQGRFEPDGSAVPEQLVDERVFVE